MSFALCRASNEYRMWEPIVFGFLVFFRPDERTATGVNTDSAYRGRQLTWPPSKRRPWVISPGNQIHLYPLSSIACGLWPGDTDSGTRPSESCQRRAEDTIRLIRRVARGPENSAGGLGHITT